MYCLAEIIIVYKKNYCGNCLVVVVTETDRTIADILFLYYSVRFDNGHGKCRDNGETVPHTCLSHTLIKSIDLLTQYSTVMIHHSENKNRLMNSHFVC